MVLVADDGHDRDGAGVHTSLQYGFGVDMTTGGTHLRRRRLGADANGLESKGATGKGGRLKRDQDMALVPGIGVKRGGVTYSQRKRRPCTSLQAAEAGSPGSAEPGRAKASCGRRRGPRAGSGPGTRATDLLRSFTGGTDGRWCCAAQGGARSVTVQDVARLLVAHLLRKTLEEPLYGARRLDLGRVAEPRQRLRKAYVFVGKHSRPRGGAAGTLQRQLGHCVAAGGGARGTLGVPEGRRSAVGDPVGDPVDDAHGPAVREGGGMVARTLHLPARDGSLAIALEAAVVEGAGLGLDLAERVGDDPEVEVVVDVLGVVSLLAGLLLAGGVKRDFAVRSFAVGAVQRLEGGGRGGLDLVRCAGDLALLGGQRNREAVALHLLGHLVELGEPELDGLVGLAGEEPEADGGAAVLDNLEAVGVAHALELGDLEHVLVAEGADDDRAEVDAGLDGNVVGEEVAFEDEEAGAAEVNGPLAPGAALRIAAEEEGLQGGVGHDVECVPRALDPGGRPGAARAAFRVPPRGHWGCGGPGRGLAARGALDALHAVTDHAAQRLGEGGDLGEAEVYARLVVGQQVGQVTAVDLPVRHLQGEVGDLLVGEEQLLEVGAQVDEHVEGNAGVVHAVYGLQLGDAALEVPAEGTAGVHHAIEGGRAHLLHVADLAHSDVLLRLHGVERALYAGAYGPGGVFQPGVRGVGELMQFRQHHREVVVAAHYSGEAVAQQLLYLSHGRLDFDDPVLGAGVGFARALLADGQQVAVDTGESEGSSGVDGAGIVGGVWRLSGADLYGEVP
ncbi:uncharacterized protein BcabD6B2_51170 [Babesia caballi]|uniref:Uncharacterized protein n=1 Tax=Babesia caballi TaxID=5871 RepID=A0AAV4M1A9_BABCB|nr:hypothetical protein BcabD6B2_51170 [Babesia caballi]